MKLLLTCDPILFMNTSVELAIVLITFFQHKSRSNGASRPQSTFITTHSM